MTAAELTELRAWLAAGAAQLPAPVLARTIAALKPGERLALEEHWPIWALDGQQEPPPYPDGKDWEVWLIMAGRGYGKTRAGAEWVNARARDDAEARIALVGATLNDVAKVMIEGESGLIAVARAGEAPVWRANARELAWPNGARAFAYSGARPDRLRGPQHHFAWCDELAAWRCPSETWDNLRLGLRLGTWPRAMVTTTPRPIGALRDMIGRKRVRQTGGKTADNPHLSFAFKAAMARDYAGTRFARQELDGMLLGEADGSLWPRELIERSRQSNLTRDEMRRVVVGVDPPASAAGNCGIIVCGVDDKGVAYVLADHSGGGLSPEGWASKVAAAAEIWRANRVVAEKNNGGAMVESVLRAAQRHLPVRLVHAADGKVARAEPVAALFEAGTARFAGAFPELEDELAALSCRGGYAGSGSPDRADAMVWAMTELMLTPKRAVPRMSVF